jgi:hypothetical protein
MDSGYKQKSHGYRCTVTGKKWGGFIRAEVKMLKIHGLGRNSGMRTVGN